MKGWALWCSIAINVYTIAALILSYWSERVSRLSGGGISPSEAMEIVPGGLMTLLVSWVALAVVTGLLWLGWRLNKLSKARAIRVR